MKNNKIIVVATDLEESLVKPLTSLKIKVIMINKKEIINKENKALAIGNHI